MAHTSLRVRLLLAVGVMVFTALVVADVVVYASLRTYLYNQVDATLEASHQSVEATAEHPESARHELLVALPPRPHGRPPSGPGESSFCAVGRETAPGMFIEVRRHDGTIVSGVAGAESCPSFAPGRLADVPRLPRVVHGLTPEASHPSERVAYFTAASTRAGGPAFRVRASTLANGDTLFVATPLTSVTSTLSRLTAIEWLVSLVALAGSLLLGAWLVRVGLRPLRDVERTAEAIAEGDLMQRVPNPNPATEVGHLATAFNVMAERVEGLVTELRASEGRLRRFVADASHELRTPIAAVSGYAQLFKRGATHGGEDLDRVADGIERETHRMAKLVEDLLLLAKLDDHEPIAKEPVELTGLVLEARETALVIGPAWPVDVIAPHPVEVLGDAGALRRVIDNLLANVRAHTPPGTHATISVTKEGGGARLEVVDDGPGLDEAHAELVFERFYREDASRSRSTGGAGLGLAIVASIVTAHGGAVRAERVDGQGSRFLVLLPTLDEPARAVAGDAP